MIPWEHSYGFFMGIDGKQDIPGGSGREEQRESTSSLDISQLLAKLGITPDISTLKNLQESINNNTSLSQSIQDDAKAAQDNPTEMARFELLYLKGFGQVVLLKDGRKVNFADIAKLEGVEKDAIIDGMSDAEYTTYEKYLDELKKAANQNEKKVDTALNQKLKEDGNVDTALNQKKEEGKNVDTALNQLNGKLNEGVEKAKKLLDEEGLEFLSSELAKVQSNPKSPIIQDLIRQGAKMEDIQSGKYNGTIESYIIIANESQLTPKDEKKAREFAQVVEQMREGIGVPPTRDNIDRFLGSKVLGENREAIGTTMRKLGETGNYDRMTWDEDTRTVTFYSRSGGEVQINTTSNPPRLSKQDGILRVEQDIHSTEEIEKQAQTMSEYETVQQNNTILEGKVVVGYSPDTERTISESEETTHISSREIRELMDTLAKPEETLETKQTTCERLITLYEHAETLPEFQAKVNPDATEVISGLRDYFYSTKVELEALKRGYENEDTLQKRLPQTDEDILTSSTDWEANTVHNFDRLNRLGLGGFQNMDEVIGFFQNERGQMTSGVWSDKENINRYLGSTKLEVSQLEGFLERLVTIYDTITGENIGEIKDKGEQRKMLQRDTGDGKTALSAALEGYRAQNGIGILHRADFERLSTQKTS